jgi:hypothetical protein
MFTVIHRNVWLGALVQFSTQCLGFSIPIQTKNLFGVVKQVKLSYKICTAVLCAGILLPTHRESLTCHVVLFTSILEEIVASMLDK